MSSSKLPKSLEEDIELISKLENVEIKELEDSLLENDCLYDDESHGIQFEDSSQESIPQVYKFQVKILLKESIYAISRKKDCVVSLHIELTDNQSLPSIHLKSILNSSVKLRNKCLHFINKVAFSGSTTSSFSIYKLIVDFKSFLQYESRNEDIEHVTENSSNFEEFITLSFSSINDAESTPNDFSLLYDKQGDNLNTESHDSRYRDTTRYNSITIYKNDRIYNHLITHSRYFREFKEEAVLGSGSFGCVIKVLRNSINYAVKQIPIYHNYEFILHEEAAVLASLQHPNIVRYYDAWVEQSPEYLLTKYHHQLNLEKNSMDRNFDPEYTPVNNDFQFGNRLDRVIEEIDFDDQFNEDSDPDTDNVDLSPDNRNVIKIHNKHYKKNKHIPKKCLFILMEYCGEESLFETINKQILQDTPQKVTDLFRQIMEALSYIHEKGIIHRDVKPSNIFLKFENEITIKLGDFGLTAKLQQSKGKNTIVNENGVVGTLHYMAPEQFECDAYNEKVDIYSAGVVLFEMLSKPFQTFMERCEILSSFSTPNKQWPEGFRERVDNRLFKLLESMLNINPNKRPSASEILQNEIFTSNKLNLQSLYNVITQYPHSMESVQLLNTIFSRKQQYKKLTDYYNMVISNNVINYVNLELGLIYDKEFKLRNAHNLHPHLLTHLPYSSKNNFLNHDVDKVTGLDRDKTFERDKNTGKEKQQFRARLLLNNGRCCNLTYSLLYSFSECTTKELATIIRRYSYSPVYSTHGTGSVGTRIEGLDMHYFLGYDIVVDYMIILNENNENEMNLDAFFTYELVSVSSRPLKRFINCALSLEWNHYEFLTKLLSSLKVPEQLLNQVERVMLSEVLVKGKNTGVFDELNTITINNQTLPSVLLNIHPFLHKFKGRVSEVKKGLEALLNCELSQEFSEYLENLQFFERFLYDFDGQYHFNPTYMESSSNCNSSNIPNDHLKEGGREGIFEKFYFRMFLEIGKRNFGDLTFGGCYNRIIENNTNRRNSFGFEMNLHPIYDYFTQNMVNKNLYNNLHLNYAPEVVVYTPQMNLIIVATSLENKFWSVGVKCYKKVGGHLNIKRITRLKKAGLFSLQKLKYLVTIKKSNENHEIQYFICDINFDNKYVSYSLHI
uniref:Serine/threonine protein kinase, putative n=1 Tax=Theileria annulata TaxID=5874 RepID=A0A3B0MP93_THEAN